VTLTPESQVQVQTACERCAGTGRTEVVASCPRHGRLFSGEELRAATVGLPCGCPWSALREDDLCPKCEGEGAFVAWVSLRELAAALGEAAREQILHVLRREGGSR
jgi:hypothetical protein